MAKSARIRGFTVIGAVFAALMIGGAGLGGWYVWRRGHHLLHPTAINVRQTTTRPSTAANPYAGWRRYCDSASGACFRYPASWSLSTSGAQTTVLNPGRSLEIDFVSPYVHDSALLDFKPTAIFDLPRSGLSLKVVGGIYLPADEPDYGIVDANLLDANSLIVGHEAHFPNALRFTDTKASGSPAIAFRARSSEPLSEMQAVAWFDSSDAKTGLRVLQSLTL